MKAADDKQSTILRMGDKKNFMSRYMYIMRVIIAIVDIITISLNNTTATKIVKIRWKHFTDVHVTEQ